MRRSVLLAGMLVAATATHALADASFDELLGKLSAGTAAPAGRVDVVAWVRRNGDRGTQLVVTLQPSGKAKLVADPGVTVTPIARPGLRWSDAEPVSRTLPGTAYFADPPTLSLPFTATESGRVEADVDYAYCIVAEQCLFGEARVSVEAGREAAAESLTPPRPGGA